MILILKSDNPYFLDILHKNPNTDEGLYCKVLKEGVLIGNCINANEYHCVFQDAKHSYMPEEGNPIDYQSYCSPLLALNMGTEFFNHLYKEKEQLDGIVISWLERTYGELDTVGATIEVPTFYLDSGWHKNGNFLLSKYIDGISLTPLRGNNYKLTVQGNSVRETFNKFSLVALFCHFTNKYSVYTFIDDYFIQKHVTNLINIPHVPYFVFYLFIKKLMRSPKQFEQFKPQLEAYFDNQIQFVFTDTHQSRKEFICNRIDLNEPVLDFGCGEMQYFRRLLKNGFTREYYAYDEVDFEETANKIKEIEGVHNLNWVDDPEKLKGFKGQVILSEVIEHNTLEEAKKLLLWIKENIEFTQLFITTPNKNFNINYELADEFRHDDHDFELSKKEFKDLIASIFPNRQEYFGVGDCVKEVYPTSAIIVYAN